MRDFQANDRVIGSELRSALVDAPERATYVVTDTNPTAPTDLEVGCDAGTVVIDGDEVSVSAQTESVSDISGEVTETAYRYHTLSVDDTGTLVVHSSDVGEFDSNDPDAEPITQVTEPSHETGEAFLGTAFQVEGAIERVFDGRYVLVDVPNSVITQGEGSGLDADTLRGDTPGELTSPMYGDGSDGAITHSTDTSESGLLLTERYEVESGTTVTVDDDMLVVYATDEILIDGTVDASGRGASGGAGGAGGDPPADGSNSDGNPGDDGTPGTDADLAVDGSASGGVGGDGGGYNRGDVGAGNGVGGSGGDGADNGSPTLTPAELRLLRIYLSDPWSGINGLTYLGGSGGGGGGGGGSGGVSADDGSSAGAGGDGGDGGDGGGVVVFVAPRVVVNGSVLAEGTDAQSGLNGQNTSDRGAGAGGGGGGGSGGDGGGIIFVTQRPATSGSVSVAPGGGAAGGSGGTATGTGAEDGEGGSAGSDGDAGLHYTISPQ